MSVEEIFKTLCERVLNGLMLHEQLSNYYDFLSLKGYKRCHEYHYMCETLMHRKLWRFYINHYGKLIPQNENTFNSVIPSNWYRYNRSEVDGSTKRKAVENAFSEWLRWENDTKAFYTERIKELESMGEFTAAEFVKEMLNSVEKEIKSAKRKQVELNTLDYAISYIISEQQGIHDKYKSKIEKIKIKL